MNDPIPLKDLVEDALQDLKNPQTRAFSKGGCLRMEREQREVYAIPWHELDTHAGLIRWLLHLSEKTWFTRTMAEKVLGLVARHYGVQR
jgi:hypothetical protein